MRTSLSALLCLALSTSLAACGGGGGDGDSGVPQTLIAFQNTGTLHILDATDATSTDSRPLILIDGMVAQSIGRVSGAIYNPAADEIWLGMGGNSFQAGGLMAIDQATSECTQVGTFADQVPGLAISSTNRIFAHAGDTTGLNEFDNSTGVGVEVNANTAGVRGNGLTFRNGILYLASSEALYTVNQTTFDATLVDDVSKAGFPTDVDGQVLSMTTRPSDGAVFAIWKDGAGNTNPGSAYLVTMNVNTAVMTYIGTLPGNYDGLAWIPTSALPDLGIF